MTDSHISRTYFQATGGTEISQEDWLEFLHSGHYPEGTGKPNFWGRVELLRVSYKDCLTTRCPLKSADFSGEVMITWCLPQKNDKSFAIFNGNNRYSASSRSVSLSAHFSTKLGLYFLTFLLCPQVADRQEGEDERKRGKRKGWN